MFHKRITAKVTKVLKVGAKKTKKSTKPKKLTKKSKVEVENPEQLIPKIINQVSSPSNYQFNVRSKFILDGVVYTVQAHYDTDTAYPQIKIASVDHGEEVMPLDTLKRHIKETTDFTVIEQ